MITRFLHHGMQVDDLDVAIKFYTSQGFTVTKEFEREDLFAKAAHVEIGSGCIELWQFESPHEYHEFIKKHVALETDNLEAEVQIFTEDGWKLVIPITQGKILKYAFVQDLQGNNIELAQR